MEQYHVQGIARILRADEMCQRQSNFLGRREAVLPVKDHAVAAIKHQDRGARALIFALANLQVLIIQIQWNFETPALDGSKQRRIYIQIQRIAEFIAPRGAMGFDSGSHLPRIMTTEA